MTKRIIYQNNEGGLSIIVPAPDCELTIEQLAQKDVPSGIPYKIIDTTDVPSDRTFRAAWEAEIAIPDGIGYGQERWFADIERDRKIEEAAARHKAELASQTQTLIEQNNPAIKDVQ